MVNVINGINPLPQLLKPGLAASSNVTVLPFLSGNI